MSTPPRSWAALILAAGASTRMGQSKAELVWQGRRFVDHLIDVFLPCCSTVLVVTGARAIPLPPTVLAIDNPAWPGGQLTSLQAGLRALPPVCDAFFFTPVDSPGVQPQTLRILQDQWRQEALIVPRYGGRHGHPVGCAATLAPEFLALDPNRQTARDVIRNYRARTRYVDVDDASILWDIDRPEDYAALQEHRG